MLRFGKHIQQCPAADHGIYTSCYMPYKVAEIWTSICCFACSKKRSNRAKPLVLLNCRAKVCVCVSLCVYVSVSVSVSVCVCACVRACATWKRNKQWVCKCLQTADLMQVFVNIYKPIKQSVLLAFWSCLWPGKISPCLHHPNPDWIEVFCEHLQTNQPICSFVCGLAKSVLVFIIPILLRNGPVSIF